MSRASHSVPEPLRRTYRTEQDDIGMKGLHHDQGLTQRARALRRTYRTEQDDVGMKGLHHEQGLTQHARALAQNIHNRTR